jgi:salicylate hydroxylase
MTRASILGTSSDPIETGDLAYRGTFSRKQLLELSDPRIEALCNKKAVTLWLGPEASGLLPSSFWPGTQSCSASS